MKNKYIESYINFLDLKEKYKKEYINDYNCILTDEKNENIMNILNIFEDVIVTINDEKIGCFTERYDRYDNSKIWVEKKFQGVD